MNCGVVLRQVDVIHQVLVRLPCRFILERPKCPILFGSDFEICAEERNGASEDFPALLSDGDWVINEFVVHVPDLSRNRLNGFVRGGTAWQVLILKRESANCSAHVA